MPKLKPAKIPTHHLDPTERIRGFDEVELGYGLVEALAEADRCLRCPRPLCVEACPSRNDIPGFITALANGDVTTAAEVLARTTSLPSVCGRLCDHARQCEGACVVGRRGDPVAIGALERFVGDFADREIVPPRPRSPKAPAAASVAVVGAGPAGLAAAEVLQRAGHDVTVYDALEVAGGVLAWGIPSFRLPDAVLRRQLDRLDAFGVEFRLGVRLGRDLSVDELIERGHAAVFLAIGAGRPVRLGIPGEDLPGVYQANDFLARAKLSRLGLLGAIEPLSVGERVAVVGAGNTAMDAAQTAIRLGGPDVVVLYRRSETEMPARSEEVQGAREEGIQFRFLTGPTKFLADDTGRVAQIECVQMALQVGPAGARPRPVPIDGSAFGLACNTVILALGFAADDSLLSRIAGLDLGPGGYVKVDGETGRTSRAGVWAGGDLVTGPKTIVGAMAWGRRVAQDIDRALRA